jgi:hypothetical protein
MPVKKESLFEILSQINVSKYTEKKGKFTYLSWSWAVSELKKVSPEAYWIIHEWGTEGNEQPYQQTESGCFVKVTVIAEGVEMTQIHPVLDNRNNTIKTPTAFEINTSIMRCLTKAISLHGLGLYIYAGEDLPLGESEKPKPLMTNPQRKKIYELIKSHHLTDTQRISAEGWLSEPQGHSKESATATIDMLTQIIEKANGLEK